MSQSIRMSDDLDAMAKSASQALVRPLAQQLECSAGLGAAPDAADISVPMATALLGKGANADAFVATALELSALPSDGLALLEERKRKDEQEIAAGRRSARSLLMFHRDELAGFTFTENPNSEYGRDGSGW